LLSAGLTDTDQGGKYGGRLRCIDRRGPGVMITAGLAVRLQGTANLMKIHTVRTAAAPGIGSRSPW